MKVLTISALLCLSFLTLHHAVGARYVKSPEFSGKVPKVRRSEGQTFLLPEIHSTIDLEDLKGDFNLTRGTARGLERFQIQVFDRFVKPLDVVKIFLTWPEVVVFGDYVLSADLWPTNDNETAKVSGSGRAELRFYNVHLKLVMFIEFLYLLPTIPPNGFDIEEFSCSTAEAHLSNVTGDGSNGDIVNQVISENLPELLEKYMMKILMEGFKMTGTVVNVAGDQGGISESAGEESAGIPDYSATPASSMELPQSQAHLVLTGPAKRHPLILLILWLATSQKLGLFQKMSHLRAGRTYSSLSPFSIIPDAIEHELKLFKSYGLSDSSIDGDRSFTYDSDDSNASGMDIGNYFPPKFPSIKPPNTLSYRSNEDLQSFFQGLRSLSSIPYEQSRHRRSLVSAMIDRFSKKSSP